MTDIVQSAPGPRVYRCTTCTEQVSLRPALCPRCAGRTLAAVQVDYGRVVAITVVERSSGLGIAIAPPYRIGLVAVAGGGRMLTLIEGVAGVGERVRLSHREAADGLVVASATDD